MFHACSKRVPNRFQIGSKSTYFNLIQAYSIPYHTARVPTPQNTNQIKAFNPSPPTLQPYPVPPMLETSPTIPRTPLQRCQNPTHLPSLQIPNTTAIITANIPLTQTKPFFFLFKIKIKRFKQLSLYQTYQYTKITF